MSEIKLICAFLKDLDFEMLPLTETFGRRASIPIDNSVDTSLPFPEVRK